MKRYGKLDVGLYDCDSHYYQVIKTNGNKSRFLVLDWYDGIVEDVSKEELLLVAKNERIIGVEGNVITPLSFVVEQYKSNDRFNDFSVLDFDKAFATIEEARSFITKEEGYMYEWLFEGYNDGVYDDLGLLETEEGCVLYIELSELVKYATLDDIFNYGKPTYFGKKGENEIGIDNFAKFKFMAKELILSNDYLILYTSQDWEVFLNIMKYIVNAFDGVEYFPINLMKCME